MHLDFNNNKKNTETGTAIMWFCAEMEDGCSGEGKMFDIGQITERVSE